MHARGLLAASAVLTCAVAAQATTASFQVLGNLTGGHKDRSAPRDVSADGSVVVGWSYAVLGSSSPVAAFRWTFDLGMVSIGDLPGGAANASGNGVSGDGSVVVGSSTSSAGTEAFRWTEAGGMVGLGDLPGGAFFSRAVGVSTDGSVVAGISRAGSANTIQAFRWTAATGMVGLGTLGGGAGVSSASDISGDGQVIVGLVEGTTGQQAAKWTSGAGWVGLGDLPTGSFRSVAYATNFDGSIIVGEGSVTNGYEAFMWTEATGLFNLGDLPGGAIQAAASGVSDDGSVVVGTGWHEVGGDQVFIWTPATGMLPLGPQLDNIVGADTRFKLVAEPTVSADGRVIGAMAQGLEYDAATESWSTQNLACRVQLPGPGACCIGGACVDNIDPIGCAQFCGVFVSDLETCATIACEDFGACCFRCALDSATAGPCPSSFNRTSTSCASMSESDCIAAEGLYIGGDCTCAAPCGCSADLNGDTETNAQDFAVMATYFGQGGPGCVAQPSGDLNCDGIVDVADFVIFASDFGCTD
jgi:probable HAF family extracellular repeat protein